MKVNVFKIAQTSPDDLSGLEHLIQTQALEPTTIVAILGKTEGNGCVNDFTRGFATQTCKHYLTAHIGKDRAEQIIYVMSGGTEGVLSPHLTLFTRQPSPADVAPHWGLVLGTSRTKDFLPAEIGTLTMVDAVEKAVRAAITDAQLTPQDVHFVQIKCPLIASSRTGLQDSQQLRTQDSYKSMAYSRGASALGVAVALGEVDRHRLKASDICANYALYSSVASTSAGIELQNCEIIVLGNGATSTSGFVIGHSVMAHGLDVAAVHQAIAHTQQPLAQIVNVFAKAEADPSGRILGRRHTMLDDSDINHTRMARAVVGAVVASVVQDPMVYVSGGAEHQGPAGGGPVAAIAAL
ncbi:MAG: ring-opening amidohydrolase [Cyanobacteria bacterium]|nr:ring-opening amidohydrolase [Cyanobacteriota bacterium]MDA0867719.1 ring-opening amidohydrolase [Cyanobacteriota bacterium]